MPNFVKVDSKPFHRDTYVGPEQDEDADAMLPKATAERNMAVKLRVENTIRWRWVKDETGEDVSGRLIPILPLTDVPLLMPAASPIECPRR